MAAAHHSPASAPDRLARRLLAWRTGLQYAMVLLLVLLLLVGATALVMRLEARLPSPCRLGQAQTAAPTFNVRA
jgi:hypothetical protein